MGKIIQNNGLFDHNELLLELITHYDVVGTHPVNGNFIVSTRDGSNFNLKALGSFASIGPISANAGSINVLDSSFEVQTNGDIKATYTCRFTKTGSPDRFELFNLHPNISLSFNTTIPVTPYPHTSYIRLIKLLEVANLSYGEPAVLSANPEVKRFFEEYLKSSSLNNNESLWNALKLFHKPFSVVGFVNGSFTIKILSNITGDLFFANSPALSISGFGPSYSTFQNAFNLNPGSNTYLIATSKPSPELIYTQNLQNTSGNGDKLNTLQAFQAYNIEPTLNEMTTFNNYPASERRIVDSSGNTVGYYSFSSSDLSLASEKVITGSSYTFSSNFSFGINELSSTMNRTSLCINTPATTFDFEISVLLRKSGSKIVFVPRPITGIKTNSTSTVNYNLPNKGYFTVNVDVSGTAALDEVGTELQQPSPNTIKIFSLFNIEDTTLESSKQKSIGITARTGSSSLSINSARSQTNFIVTAQRHGFATHNFTQPVTNLKTGTYTLYITSRNKTSSTNNALHLFYSGTYSNLNNLFYGLIIDKASPTFNKTASTSLSHNYGRYYNTIVNDYLRAISSSVIEPGSSISNQAFVNDFNINFTHYNVGITLTANPSTVLPTSSPAAITLTSEIKLNNLLVSNSVLPPNSTITIDYYLNSVTGTKLGTVVYEPNSTGTSTFTYLQPPVSSSQTVTFVAVATLTFNYLLPEENYTNQATTSITVNPYILPSISIIAPTTGDSYSQSYTTTPPSINFDCNFVDGTNTLKPGSYKWFIDGNFETSSKAFSKTFTEGVYIIKVQAEDTNDVLVEDTLTLTITRNHINPSGNLNLPGSITIIEPATSQLVNVTVSSFDPGTRTIVRYILEVNGNEVDISSTYKNVYQISVSNNSTVVYKVIDSNNNTYIIDTKSIVVNFQQGQLSIDLPEEIIEFEDDPAASISITATVSGSSTYTLRWYLNNTLVSGTSLTNTFLLPPGNHQVKCIATNSSSSAEDITNITILRIPKIEYIEPVVNLSEDATSYRLSDNIRILDPDNVLSKANDAIRWIKDSIGYVIIQGQNTIDAIIEDLREAIYSFRIEIDIKPQFRIQFKRRKNKEFIDASYSINKPIKELKVYYTFSEGSNWIEYTSKIRIERGNFLLLKVDYGAFRFISGPQLINIVTPLFNNAPVGLYILEAFNSNSTVIVEVEIYEKNKCDLTLEEQLDKAEKTVYTYLKDELDQFFIKEDYLGIELTPKILLLNSSLLLGLILAVRKNYNDVTIDLDKIRSCYKCSNIDLDEILDNFCLVPDSIEEIKEFFNKFKQRFFDNYCICFIEKGLPTVSKPFLLTSTKKDKIMTNGPSLYLLNTSENDSAIYDNIIYE